MTRAALLLAALAGAPALPLLAPSRALAQQSRTVTAEEIARLVDDGLAAEDRLVAEEAADAICALGKRAVPRVVNALVRNDARRKRRAAALLGRLGDPAAIDPLAALLGDTRGDEDLKLAVARALLELGSREGVAALIDLLESGDRLRRLEAFTTLRRYTHHAFNFDHDGPAGPREKSVAEWRAWWKAARADFRIVEPLSPPMKLPPAGPLPGPVPPMPAPPAPRPTPEPAASTPTAAAGPTLAPGKAPPPKDMPEGTLTPTGTAGARGAGAP